MDNEQPAAAPQPQQQPQAMKIDIGGGIFPLPNGTYTVSTFFTGFQNLDLARQFMAQLDGMVKSMFAPPPGMAPQPPVNGPAPPADDSGITRQ
jgi:hypothetical protein